MSYGVSAGRNGDKVACFIFDETRGSAVRRAKQLGMDPEPLIESGLMTIDQVVAASRFGKIDFLKMDIEGSEEQALSGAADTMPHTTVRAPRLASGLY